MAIRATVDHEPTYVCRKGFHALNIQIICDADIRITNIISKWPGSSHGAYIFENSNIYRMFEAGTITGGYLLGDSGYANRPYLLTPFLQPNGDGQERYNNTQIKTRNVVERCIELLKSRFRSLQHKSAGCLMRLKPTKCAEVIVACAILHNICLENRVPMDMGLLEDDDLQDEVDQNNNVVVNIEARGPQIRDILVRERFS